MDEGLAICSSSSTQVIREPHSSAPPTVHINKFIGYTYQPSRGIKSSAPLTVHVNQYRCRTTTATAVPVLDLVGLLTVSP